MFVFARFAEDSFCVFNQINQGEFGLKWLRLGSSLALPNYNTSWHLNFRMASNN